MERKREEKERKRELERRRKEEEERKIELERKRKEEEERKIELERKRKEEEERKRELERKREEEERKRELERKRKEEEERKRELERKRKEEEDRKRELERKREEEEERKRELERKRKEEEERKRELERKRKEEEDRKRELERKREEEEERKRELERKRKEEEERKRELERKREEEDERKRQLERKRKEEEERKRELERKKEEEEERKRELERKRKRGKEQKRELERQKKEEKEQKRQLEKKMKEEKERKRQLEKKMKEDEERKRQLEKKMKEDEERKRQLEKKMKEEEERKRQLEKKMKEEEERKRQLEKKMKEEEERKRQLEKKMEEEEERRQNDCSMSSAVEPVYSDDWETETETDSEEEEGHAPDKSGLGQMMNFIKTTCKKMVSLQSETNNFEESRRLWEMRQQEMTAKEQEKQMRHADQLLVHAKDTTHCKPKDSTNRSPTSSQNPIPRKSTLPHGTQGSSSQQKGALHPVPGPSRGDLMGQLEVIHLITHDSLGSTAVYSGRQEEEMPSLLFLVCVSSAALGVNLLALALYLSFLCCCQRSSEAEDEEETKKPNSHCVTWTAVTAGLLSCIAVGVGFYGNSETNDGVYQLTYSLYNTNHTLVGVETLVSSTLGGIQTGMKEHLSRLDEIFATRGDFVKTLKFVQQMAESLVKNLLGLPDWDQAKVDLTDIADRTAAVEYYSMMVFSMLILIVSWASLGVEVATAVGVSDFCVSPDKFIMNQTKDAISTDIVHYYLYCNQTLPNPFQQSLTVIQRSLTAMQIQVQGLLQFAVPLFPTAESRY
ncbi:hypothetical protein QTP70_012077 [Hemibagrus guttatus]|uniref:Protein tweety homolog n=1 Tax=Hemibagrus guttatus TaxID=175788 RepID=A0AAE0QNS5_9TELE|nr:hypothetical protein QTP70_012077 [Hemibagrus guttatus]